MLVDSRLGFTELDLSLLDFISGRIDNGAVKLLVLLTKADKLSKRALDVALTQAQEALAGTVGESADVSVAPFSALDRRGVADAAMWLHRRET